MKKITIAFLLTLTAILTLSSTTKENNISVETNNIPKDTVTLVHLVYKTLWSSTLN